MHIAFGIVTTIYGNKQKLCEGGIGDLVTQIKPSYEMPESDEIASILGESSITYRPETEDENAEFIWPFIIGEKLDKDCIYASNIGIDSSYAIIYADVTLKKGEALGFDYLASSERFSDVLYVIVDDDDVYLPNKISNQVRFMVDGDLDFAVTDLDLYYDDGSLAEHKTRKYIQRTDSQSLLTYHLMYHITGTDTMMFKRDYLVSIGAFPPIDIGDEFYLMLRSIENGGRFGYLPTCDVRAIVHRDGTGLSGGDGKIEGENKLYEYKKQYFGRLDMKAKRYIRMRHHAVLAFAQKRRGKKLAFVREGLLSALASPVACIEMLKKRQNKTEGT